MNQDLELKLQAWVDGELADAESRRMADLVARDADARQLVSDLRALKLALDGAELPRSVPESREFFWSKIERQIQHEAAAASVPEQSPALSWRDHWRRWLTPVAVCAAAACVMLVTLKQSTPTHSKLLGIDEITATDEGMEAMTFHDQSAGLTVVWLQDKPAAENDFVDHYDDSTVTD